MNASRDVPRLGRGLETLFGERSATSGEQLRKIPIERLVPNPAQPRGTFGDVALAELARSIGERGVLQPLIVRPSGHEPDAFEIVAGERRWRAAQQAGLHELPAVVRDLGDEEALAVALVENLQRDDLTPIEEAEAYALLARDFGKSPAAVAEMVGKSRPHVANTLRLLELPDGVRALVSEGALTAGHARALLGVSDPAATAKDVVAKGLSVRETEKLVAAGRRRTGTGGGGGGAPSKDADVLALEKRLGDLLGLKVDVAFDGKRGKLTVFCGSLEQFDDLVARLEDRSVHRHAIGGSASLD